MTLWDSDNTSDAFLLKHTGERAVVGVTCCLSIIGSLAALKPTLAHTLPMGQCCGQYP